MTDTQTELSGRIMFTEDVAELMHVTPQTVRWWVSVGRAPRSFRPGGSKRRVYLAEDVYAWLNAERGDA